LKLCLLLQITSKISLLLPQNFLKNYLFFFKFATFITKQPHAILKTSKICRR
jgi:hypothetical protein